MKRFALLLVGSMILAGITPAASAALIQIQLGGVDLQYNGNNVTDGYPSGPNPDPLTNATFVFDGTDMKPADTTDVTLNLNLSGVLSIPDTGGTVDKDTTGKDITGTLELDLDPAEGVNLSLELSSGSVTYIPLTETVQFVFVGSNATVITEDLPYEISFAGDVAVSFSTQIVQPVGKSGGFLTNFRTSGTGEIQGLGTGVPEPASLGLLTLGGLAVLRRRRK